MFKHLEGLECVKQVLRRVYGYISLNGKNGRHLCLYEYGVALEKNILMMILVGKPFCGY